MRLTSEARFPLKIDWERVRSLPEWQQGGSLGPLAPPLVAFPLKSEWEALHPADAEPFPEPLRGSDAPGGIPNYPEAVSKLVRAARGAGWAVEVTYAVGYLPHASYGRPSEAKESFGVRMTRGTDRAVAVHMAGTWTLLRRSSRMFEPYAGVADFTDDLCGVMVTLPSGTEWAKMLVKYPLRPTRKQREEMEALNEAYRAARS